MALFPPRTVEPGLEERIAGYRQHEEEAATRLAYPYIARNKQTLSGFRDSVGFESIDPERDPSGSGWHILQSKIAIGSGGFTGKGFMQGTQAQLNFLPEKHTDFIFTMFSEEMGFIGAAVLLALYLLVLLFITYMALRCRSTFPRLVAAGMGLCLFAYVFINVAMVTGLMPVVGVPLPLVSYGGTALISLFIGLGILISVQAHRKLVMT